MNSVEPPLANIGTVYEAAPHTKASPVSEPSRATELGLDKEAIARYVEANIFGRIELSEKQADIAWDHFELQSKQAKQFANSALHTLGNLISSDKANEVAKRELERGQKSEARNLPTLKYAAYAAPKVTDEETLAGLEAYAQRAWTHYDGRCRTEQRIYGLNLREASDLITATQTRQKELAK